MPLTRFRFDVDGLTIEGEGVVQVTGAPADDVGGAVVAFLSNLDPAVIEQAALDRQDCGTSLSAAVFAVLRDIASRTPL